MNWKESNLFIAVSASVGTALFLITVFFTVIIPTWTESYKNEIKDLKNVIPKYPQIVKDLKEREGTITELEAELKAMRLENIFADSNPYPSGYRDIIIGNPLSKVRKVYPEHLVDQVEGSVQDTQILKVKIDHTLFAVIYYGSTEKRGNITSIIFFFNDPYDGLSYQTLMKKFKQAFPYKQYSESIRNNKKICFINNLNQLNIELSEVGMTIFER